MKKQINVFEYSEQILTALQKGVLLTTKGNEKVNTMVISWGNLGIEWHKNIFTVYVRENRYTKRQLDENGEFTINIPLTLLEKDIIRVAGTKSGHNIDKVKELNLTLIDSDTVSVPAIKEVPLTLECKVVYRQAQNPDSVTETNRSKYYPQDVSSDFHGANKDYHTAYYGEITAAYIIE